MVHFIVKKDYFQYSQSGYMKILNLLLHISSPLSPNSPKECSNVIISKKILKWFNVKLDTILSTYA